MSFFDELNAFSNSPLQQVSLFQQWLAERPLALFDELRLHVPILQLPGLAVVTKYCDVADVLARDQEFGVPDYAKKMHRATGDFFLGMEDGPDYEREVSIMRLASNRQDLTRIAGDLQAWIDEVIAAKAAGGTLDVVGDLSRRVPGRLVSEYFGASGMPDALLLDCLRALFRDIFANPGDDPVVRDAAATASSALCAHLDNLVETQTAQMHQGAALADTVLSRCVGMSTVPETSFEQAGIRRNIAGLIVGTVDTTSACVANVLDYLLGNPGILDKAITAAREGTLDDVRGYVYEALRFKPQAPTLLRTASVDAVLAAGTARAITVPAGTTVVVCLMSGMFDPDQFPAPTAFDPQRPERDYLHFGSGMHRCFGRHINRLQLPMIVRAILRLPGLRRAAGADGEMRLDGPFPNRLIVEFDTARS
ncbi:MAG: putative cytochrome hydroxylase [Massilia sp.]|nr:putative cytochrome hydroxylase [Massilia sp.]